MNSRCTLCPRFSAAPLCQRCGRAVELHAARILHGAAVQLAEQLRRHAEEQDRQAMADLDRASTLPPGKVTGDAPEPVTTGDLAAGGRQGSQARDLLHKAERQGQRLLHTLLKASLTRLLTSGPSRLILARSLFTDEERKQLTEGLAGVLAPANLLGRARVRKRLSPATFADPDIKPMAPEKALAYFQGLVPGITGDPQRFGPDMRRRAFTLAVSTEKGLLDRVKGVLANSLESGEATTSTSRQVQDLLDRAGVSPRNPGYATMVVRTNIGEALNQGQQEEFDDPDLADLFPVWRYDGIEDGRERASHAVHFGHYFPRGVPFAKVRDSVRGRFDGYQCRCAFTPIDAADWEELQAQGARVEPGWGPTDAPATKGKRKKATPAALPEPPPAVPTAAPAPEPSRPLPDPGEVYGGITPLERVRAAAAELGIDPTGKSDFELRNAVANAIDMRRAAPPPPPTAPAVAPAPAAPAAPDTPLPAATVLAKRKPLADEVAAAAAGAEHLTDEQRRDYAATVRQVVGRMPKKAQELARKHLNRVTFYPESQRITEGAIQELLDNDPTLSEEVKAVLRVKLEETRRGKYNAGGVFSQIGGIHLDGDYDYMQATGAGPEQGKYTSGAVFSRRDVYSHELTHAIDGPEGARLSGTAGWREAYDAEINYDRQAAFITGKEPPLTAYAATMPEEGFAEFGRLVYGTDVPLQQIEKDFPRASAFFKEKGLWPAANRQGKAKKAAEVFEERVELDGKGSHLDTLLAPRPAP